MRVVDKRSRDWRHTCGPFLTLCENRRWLCSNPGPWPLGQRPAQSSWPEDFPLAGRILPLKVRALLRGRQQTVFSWLAIIDGQLDQTIRGWRSQFLALNRPDSRLFRIRRLFVVDLRLGLARWLRRSGLVYAHNPGSAAALFIDLDQRAM